MPECEEELPEFEEEVAPENPEIEKSPRASYYDLETSRAFNRREHQQHLRRDGVASSTAPSFAGLGELEVINQ